jgi:GNAT superfamily N-acetyltransferase
LEYDPWRPLSRFAVVVSDTGGLCGAVRVLVGAYQDLPAGRFDRDRAWPDDPVLEYASLAVDPTVRSTGVAEALYRQVWQDAVRAGARGMVCIGEDWLFKILNDTYGFGFEPLGPSRWYMGGECMPMGVDIGELAVRLEEQPSFFSWVSTGLDPADVPSDQVRQALAHLAGLHV